jgi:YegS/Rv2252/BmrU family lipid kinase
MFTPGNAGIILNQMPNLKDSLLLIVNPASGDGKAIDMLPAIDDLIGQMGITYDIQITDTPAQATALAKTAALFGYGHIVAVGGDGTVNEIAAGLIETDTTLGVIPAGRSNDFFRSLGITGELERVCRVAVLGKAKLMDVGFLNEQPFFNSVGVGFAAEMVREANRLTEGRLAYFKAIYNAWKKYSAYELNLRIDNLELKLPATMVLANIGKISGGGFRATPQALVDDGKFDVCVMEKIKRTEIISFLPKFARGTHLRLPEIKMYRCRQLEIASKQTLPVHYEGEIYHNANGRFMLKILPKKLKVAVRLDTNDEI